MTDSERLKAARKTLGLTERQMAAALGMRGKNAKDDLRKMEEDMRPVTGPALVAAEALAVIRDLLVTMPPVWTDEKADALKRARALVPEAAL